MRIIAFVTDSVSVRRVLKYIGKPAQPPKLAPARGPPAWEAEAGPLPLPLPDPIAQTEPNFKLTRL